MTRGEKERKRRGIANEMARDTMGVCGGGKWSCVCAMSNNKDAAVWVKR